MNEELCNDSVQALQEAQFADILEYKITESSDKTGYLIYISNRRIKYIYESNKNLPMRFKTQKNAIDLIRTFNEKLPIYILAEPSKSEKTTSDQLHKYANEHLSEIDWNWRTT